MIFLTFLFYFYFFVGHFELFLYCRLFPCSLGGLHWFGIKVAFSINGGLFLSVRGVSGIHIVRWDGSCYGTQAGHGDLEELCIKFLEFRQHQISHFVRDKGFNTVYLFSTNKNVALGSCLTLCAKDSKIPQKSLRER